MPSDKRARKRAAREARMAALERRKRRRSLTQRVVVVAVVVALAAGIYALVGTGGKAKPAKAGKSTTTSTSSTSTTLPPNAVSTTTSVNLAGDTTSANCPSPFTATTPLKKPTFSSPPPMIIDTTKAYSATLNTDVGSLTIALDAKNAPKTVNNFVFLAENHFYDCIVFHRVIPGFMDQVGDPTGTGSGGPGYKFADENTPSGGYTAGEVAMANSGPNTDGSQFFVLVAPYTNTGYSLFGHVTDGMAVAQKINGDGTSAGTPKVLHRIISVVISAS